MRDVDVRGVEGAGGPRSPRGERREARRRRDELRRSRLAGRLWFRLGVTSKVSRVLSKGNHLLRSTLSKTRTLRIMATEQPAAQQ